jgi:hypothetical protein
MTRRPLPAPPAGDPPADAPAPSHVDDRELARFHRPQPPAPIPERVRPQPLVGLLAQELLGARVYRRPR